MHIWNRIHLWLHPRENLLLLALIVAHLIPLWAFQYFPSQDGPVHIENANIILDYFQPDRAIFRVYYLFNKNPEPTWLGHLVLAGLMADIIIRGRAASPSPKNRASISLSAVHPAKCSNPV